MITHLDKPLIAISMLTQETTTADGMWEGSVHGDTHNDMPNKATPNLPAGATHVDEDT